jgi:hypothetical protein
MTDYSERSNDEINREVGRQLGWRKFSLEPAVYDMHYPPDPNDLELVAIPPDGGKHGTKRAVPDWAGSVDAALTLPLEDGWLWEIATFNGKEADVDITYLLNVGMGYHGADDTVSRAMSEAWLKYNAARREAVPA